MYTWLYVMESAKNRSSWIHGFGNERQRIVAKYDLPELIEKLTINYSIFVANSV